MLTDEDKAWLADLLDRKVEGKLAMIRTELERLRVDAASIDGKVNLLLEAHPQLAHRAAAVRKAQDRRHAWIDQRESAANG